VREGKGAKRRVVPITEKVSNELEDYYLNERCNPQPLKGSFKTLDTEAFFTQCKRQQNER